MQSRRRHKLFRILVTRYPIATSIAKFKKAFFYKVINKESTIDFATKSKYNRAFYYTPGFSFFGKNSKTNHRLVSISNVRSKNALAALPSQIHSLLTELRMLNINKDSSFPVDLSNILSYRYAVSPSLSKQRKSSILPIKTIESFKSFFRNRGMVQSSLNTFNVKNDFDKSAIYKKRHILQKRVYSLRLHKSLLPSATRLRKFSYSTKSLNNIPYKKASFFYRAYLRGIYFRFINKRRKKRIRRRKIIRLKKLHFYIPTYLHVDFRTLRAIKISSPSLEEINYSFRGSLAKVYSYYSARGF